MSKLLIEVDDEALAEAQSLLGTSTTNDTVNAALVEVSKRMKRVKASVELAASPGVVGVDQIGGVDCELER